MSDKIWFDYATLWDEATKFIGWKYRLNPERYPPGPTYPEAWLRLGKEKGIKAVSALQGYLANTSHNTNCCMFTESVIIGAAMRGPAFEFSVDLHNDAINRDNKVREPPPCPPVMAYVTAGMAEIAEPGDRPAPGDWCLCQSEGHSFFIIDYDEKTEFCLTLEANVFINENKSVYTGFVGHSGRLVADQEYWGIELQPRKPDRWAERMAAAVTRGRCVNDHLVKWSALEKKIVRFARLNLRPSASFYSPFDVPNSPPNRVRPFINNEDPSTGFGGPYALSTSRTLHGGIHLFGDPGVRNVQVRVMAPGYIVAARLPPLLPGAAASSASQAVDSTTASAVAQNWTGFVLVRHEFEVVGAQPAKILTLYGLYMHLLPPDYSNLDADPYCGASGNPGAPWFKELVTHRFGSWICVGLGGPCVPGTIFWSKEKYQTGKSSYAVYGRPEPIEPQVGGKTLWMYRPPPLELTAVLEALQAGKVVAFPEPFFRFGKSGEPVGLAGPFFTPETRDSARAELHWEILSPVASGASAIRDLLDLAEKKVDALKGVLKGHEISEISDDNFLSSEELNKKVLPALTKDEQAILQPGFKEIHDDKSLAKGELRLYRAYLKRLLNDKATFAPQAEYDGTQGARLNALFTYPVTLQIEVDLLPKPNDNAQPGPYELAVKYWSTPEPSSSDPPLVEDKVVLDQGLWGSREENDPAVGATGKKVLSIRLKVPADAQSLSLSTADDRLTFAASLRRVDGGLASLLRVLAPHRWRRVLLSHLNEWSPSSIQALFGKLKDIGLVAPSFDLNAAKPLAWWHEEHSALRNAWEGISRSTDAEPDVQSVAPAHRQNGSLFGTASDQLPKDAKIDNLHPGLVVCLLDLLCGKAEALAPKSSWEVKDFHKDPFKPFGWGWLYDATPVLGDTVHAMVVSHDIAYDRRVSVEAQVEIAGTSYPLFRKDYKENGFVNEPIVVDFWGKATLRVKGASQAPEVALSGTVLQIARPELDTITADERASGSFKTFKAGKSFVVPVKLKTATPQPKSVGGVIGIQFRKGDSGSWRDAKLGGEKTFIRAVATSAPGGDTATIDASAFVIDSDMLVGRNPKGAAKDKITSKLNYEVLRQKQINGGVRIGASIAITIQELRRRFDAGVDPIALARSGLRAVVAASVKARTAEIAALALDLPAIQAIHVPGDSAPLTRQRLNEAAVKADLAKLGLEIVIASAATFEQASTAFPESKFAKGLSSSDDQRFIVGVDAKVNPKQDVTANFGFGELKNKLNPLISVRLIHGLEKLAGRLDALVSIDPSGMGCTFSFTNQKGRDSLVAAATESGAFSPIVPDEEKHWVHLAAAPATTLFAAVDPRPALAKLYATETADGKESSFRFYFCPINGMSLAGPAAPKLGEVIKASQIPNIGGGGLGSPVFGSESEVGKLRPLRFENPQFHLVEKKVRVSCQLRGSKEGWDPFKVTITQSFGGKTQSASPAIAGGDPLIVAEMPYPGAGNATYTVEATPKPDAPAVEWIAPPSASASLNLTPTFDARNEGASALKIEPLGASDLFVFCRTRGIPTPAGLDIKLEEARSGKVRADVPVATTAAWELELAITPAITPNPLKASYAISGGKVGFVNQEGVFCAIIKNARSLMTKGTAYTFKVQRPAHRDARGLTPITATHTEPR